MTLETEKPIILCMFSGGLDSVGVLYQLLTAPEYAGFEIQVHHMHLLNREERAEAEAHAVTALYEAFREATGRHFTTTENVMEYRFMERNFMWDMDLAAFMSANIVRVTPGIAKVAMGRTKTDITDAKADFHRRMERAQNLFEVLLSLEKGPIPERIFPVVEFTKAEIFEMLPEAIRKHAWSCRTPIYFDDAPPKPCEKCHTCADLKAMREALTS
ncbi:7-cyano-7-deazaguanine synthase [Verrucomicrobiaceae bacterium 227]